MVENPRSTQEPVTETRIYHYTDEEGFKAIRSQKTWVFKASRPPGNHPGEGAYFTSLEPGTLNLAKRLRIPRDKVSFVFCFL